MLDGTAGALLDNLLGSTLLGYTWVYAILRGLEDGLDSSIRIGVDVGVGGPESITNGSQEFGTDVVMERTLLSGNGLMKDETRPRKQPSSDSKMRF